MLMPQLTLLSKNTLIYGVGGFLNRFIGFLLLPVFTAYLTPEDYGISAILSWVAFLLSPLFSLGLGAAIAPCYFEGNNTERKESTLWTAFNILLISSGVLATIGVVFARPISYLAFKTCDSLVSHSHYIPLSTPPLQLRNYMAQNRLLKTYPRILENLSKHSGLNSRASIAHFSLNTVLCLTSLLPTIRG